MKHILLSSARLASNLFSENLLSIKMNITTTNGAMPKDFGPSQPRQKSHRQFPKQLGVT